jgi:putative PIN family toxin of toxin-antitoxin system
MRVVLDANLFVSAAIEPRGRPAQILDAWRAGLFDLIVRDDILAEIGEVLRRPRIQRRHAWSDEQVGDFMSMLRKVAVLAPGVLQVTAVADDSDDDMYLACALEGEAEYIVSGDDHLRDLGTYRGITIVSARQFLAILSA